MCGRIVSITPPSVLARRFGAAEVRGERRPSYNLAPSAPIWAVTAEGGTRRLETLRWGFVPAFAKDPARVAHTINARIERATTSPAFRRAMARRRCLVPVDGFYEWRPLPGPGRPRRQPYAFRRADGDVVALAGLFEEWHGPEGEVLRTCAILTEPAAEPVAAVHDRMPVVLTEDRVAGWLDVANVPPAEAAALARAPLPEGLLVGYPVSTAVNSPRNDGPELLEPVPLPA